MSRKWAVAVMILVPVLSQAQGSPDSVAYRRAQTLVNDGNAATGRAIVDSMLGRATPGTNAYAEGLYWRAVLSATASDAEMDYRRIVVDYPLSPRVEDVLLRLAQLELARADYDGALQHLNRLTLEHPVGLTRARAGYWTARVLFEKNDVQRACAVNADALAQTNANDTELRNQISYLNQRCVGVVMASSAVPASTNAPAADSTGNVTANAPAPITDSLVKPTTVASKSSMQPPTSPRDVNPSMIVPGAPEGTPVTKTATPKTATPKTATPKTATPKTVAPSSAGTAGEGGYSVQVAAYNVKLQAQAMVDKLKERGYDARVSGTSAPFRVRIGHYATQAQASAVMRSLKAKQIDGFVVKAE